MQVKYHKSIPICSGVLAHSTELAGISYCFGYSQTKTIQIWQRVRDMLVIPWVGLSFSSFSSVITSSFSHICSSEMSWQLEHSKFPHMHQTTKVFIFFTPFSGSPTFLWFYLSRAGFVRVMIPSETLLATLSSDVGHLVGEEFTVANSTT